MRKKKRSICKKIHISKPKSPSVHPCTAYECVQRASDLKDISISRKTGNKLKKFIWGDKKRNGNNQHNPAQSS